MTSMHKILIVDDTEENIEILLDLLKEFDLLVAVDGEGALELLEEETVDLVLLDIVMPGIDGYETCRRIKQIDKLKDVAVIFSTAKTDDESIDKAYKMGAVDFVSKPFKPLEILARVKNQLKLSDTLAELKQTQNHMIQQEKMAGLGTLTAGVMHEINNPTNFTHASLYSLKQKMEDLFTFLEELAGGEEADETVLQLFSKKRVELESIINTAEEGTSRIKAIVADLSNFSRIDKGKKKLADIKGLVESSVNLSHTKFPNIIFDCEEVESVEFFCFQSKLSQVLLNLFVNSCQAIEQAQLIQPDIQGKIAVSTKVISQNLKVVVTDNGCGMESETVKKVFEPFFTTKDVGKGTGLGMSISYSIIEEHGGKLTVQSQPGKGTQISILLPM